MDKINGQLTAIKVNKKIIGVKCPLDSPATEIPRLLWIFNNIYCSLTEILTNFAAEHRRST